MNKYEKYDGVIEKITVADATFKGSTQNEIVPTWINYFYGNNGTGKSTIARAIKALKGLEWSSGKSATDYVIRQFSRDFIEDELKFEDESPSMPGVLTLGEEFIAAQDLITEKKKVQDGLTEQIELAYDKHDKLEEKREKADAAFSKEIWKASEPYRKAFGGNKGDFRSEALCKQRLLSTTPVERNADDLKRRYDITADPNARKYDLFTPLDLSRLDNAENFALLSEPIISTSDSQFSRFMHSLDATAWVKEGYEKYASKTDGKCPYCQQSIRGLAEDIETQIAECFKGEFLEACKKLANYQHLYDEYTAGFVANIKQYVEFLKSIPQGFGNIPEYEKHLALLEKTIIENKQRIAAKVSKPSETTSLDTIRPSLEAVNNLINETNKLFKNNNTVYDHKEKEQAACMTEVWELLAFDLRTTVQKFLSADKAVEEELDEISSEISEHESSLGSVKSEIAKLTEKMGGSGAIIQKVNGLLTKTGFRGFSLQEHKSVPDRYVVVRDDGTAADKLSEGERNFIAFLYFYYLAQGSWKREDLLKGKIVVIDDPVSSMDSGVLSIAASLTRELINDCFCDGENYNIKQIFILTHNPYFHNAVSQEMLRPEEMYYKKVAFFEVKKGEDNISTVSQPCIQESNSKDPDITCENYSPVQNSYTALWQEYKDAKLPTTLLHIIHRIIDFHFILLCSYEREELRKRIVEYVGNDMGKMKLINAMLLNIHDSTIVGDSVDEMVYFPAPDSSTDYKAAFGTIFKALGQEAHFAKMSGEGAYPL